MSILLRFFVFLFAITSLTSCYYTKNPANFPPQSKNLWLKNTSYNIAGAPICPNNRICNNDELIPNRPCSEPMPTYYDNKALHEADILLIQPYSRTIVVCNDEPGFSAYGCAEYFKKQGFILITDIPQFTAKYDVIVEGNYPSRKWGANKSQTAPRW